jgi:hypothetical protein
MLAIVQYATTAFRGRRERLRHNGVDLSAGWIFLVLSRNVALGPSRHIASRRDLGRFRGRSRRQFVG